MYRLQSCVWELTLACPFNCPYCGSGGGRVRENELTTKECLELIKELKELDCERVSLIGGEVFLRSDWMEIVEALVREEIRVNVISNGYIITEKEAARLKTCGVESVSISIDGTEAIHDKYRQKGSYQKALDALEKLQAKRIPISVITTLNSENVQCLDMLYRELIKYPLYAWQLQACSPMGNALGNQISYAFDHKNVIEFVSRTSKTAPFAVGVADNIGYFTPEEGSIRGNKSGEAFFTGCSAGLSSVGIDSVGNVRGCESMNDPKFIEGNVRDESLISIWNDPERFSYNRKFVPECLTGKCSTCRMGEYCGGGCRSLNYFIHGRMYESPYCARVQDNETDTSGFR